MEVRSRVINYRLMRGSDIEGVRTLWRDHSGWGDITEKQVRDWYLDTPYGACIVALAVDDQDRVLGQKVFMPARLVIDEEEVGALRVLAPILHRDFRQASLSSRGHPAFNLYRCGMEEACRQGYRVTYSFPAYGWQTFMKAFPRVGLPGWNIASYGCLGLSLVSSETLPRARDGLLPSSVEESFGPAFDRLWADARISFPVSCGIVRTRQWLTWKKSDHLALAYHAAGTGELFGYAVINRGTGLLLDALARTETDLALLVRNLVRTLHHHNPDRVAITAGQLTVMETPLLRTLCGNMSFHKVDFRFAFGCNFIDGTEALRIIDPSRWYLMPND